MIEFNPTYILWAILLGAISAVSLPLGSAVGLLYQPRPRITGILAAFGAGALIAALAVELVAPTVEAIGQGDDRAEAVANFLGLILGAIVGGILFVVLNQVVNARGGFLRKTSATVSYFTTRKRKRIDQMFRDLCSVSLLRELPADQVGLLVRDVRPESFPDGEVLFEEGQRGSKLFFVRDGEIELYQGDRLLRTLKRGEVVGELALLTGAPRAVTAKAKGSVSTLVLYREDFDRWRRMCPELDSGLKRLASERLSDLEQRKDAQHAEARRWAEEAIAAFRQGAEIPTPAEIREMKAEHSGAPLAVWLGILLDGIPESFVIGAGFLGILSISLSATGQANFFQVIPYTLIAGLFLSNFPEAMSSSVGMKMQGWSPKKIFFMWTALMVVTALGAGVGYLLGDVLPHSFVITAEGLAAGAMLTLIASAMIPEAVHLGGGNVVGISTLMGFLSAIAFKLFE